MLQDPEQFPQPPLDGTVSAFSTSSRCKTSWVKFFFFKSRFWRRIKIPVGVYHLKPVQDLQCVCVCICVCVCVCVCVRQRKTKTERVRWVHKLFNFLYVTMLCVIKCTSVCFRRCLVKCIWSSHTPPTPVPDSLLFIPCLCPCCSITYTEVLRCVCTCVRAGECNRVCVYVRACAGAGGTWACVFLREQKQERQEHDR